MEASRGAGVGQNGGGFGLAGRRSPETMVKGGYDKASFEKTRWSR